MKTLKLRLLVATSLAVFALVGGSAHAYFYQPQQYQSYQYQTYNPYNYGYQDTVSQLIQGQLNFVSNFTYIPSPIRSYFYYSPFSYFGGYSNYGYGYNYGYYGW